MIKLKILTVYPYLCAQTARKKKQHIRDVHTWYHRLCSPESTKKCFLSHINLIMDSSNKLPRSLKNLPAQIYTYRMCECKEEKKITKRPIGSLEYEISTRTFTHRRFIHFIRNEISMYFFFTSCFCSTNLK